MCEHEQRRTFFRCVESKKNVYCAEKKDGEDDKMQIMDSIIPLLFFVITQWMYGICSRRIKRYTWWFYLDFFGPPWNLQKKNVNLANKNSLFILVCNCCSLSWIYGSELYSKRKQKQRAAWNYVNLLCIVENLLMDSPDM